MSRRNSKHVENEAQIRNLLEIVNELGGSIFYLDDTNSDIGGYESLNTEYRGGSEANYPVNSASNGDAIEEFVTAIGEPGTSNLLIGQYTVHLHVSKTGGTMDCAIYFDIYKRTHPGGAETFLGTSHHTPFFEGADNSLATYIHLPDTEINATDRIVLKFKVAVSGFGLAPSIILHVQGDSTSRFRFPFTVPGLITNDFVRKDGDTMTGDLNVGGFSGSPTIIVGGVGDGDAILQLLETSTSFGFTWGYDGGDNKLYLYYHNNRASLDRRLMEFNRDGSLILWRIANVEKMRLDTNSLTLAANIFIANAHTLGIFSAGGDKRINILHNDTDGLIEVPSGDGDLRFDVDGAEKMQLDTNNLTLQTNADVKDGHNFTAFSSGDDKGIVMEHNDTDGLLRVFVSGAIETRSSALNVRNIADNDYVDVNANAFNEVSKKLPDDPENWKELLPEFLKTMIYHDIIEKYEEEIEVEYTDENGELQIRTKTVTKSRKIGEDNRVGINIGMTARLALREVELLKVINADLIKRIEELETAIGKEK